MKPLKPFGYPLKLWVLGLSILLGVEVSVLNYFNLPGSPLKEELKTLEIDYVNGQEVIKKSNEDLKHEEKLLKGLSQEGSGIKYFKNSNIPWKLQIPQLLEEISTLVKNLGIRYVAVQLEPSEDYKFHRKHSFSIKASSKFKELVEFIERIENDLKLTAGNFNIRQNKENSSWYNVELTLSTLELKSDAPSETRKESRRVPSTAKISTPKKISKDPFFVPYKKRSKLKEDPSVKKKPKFKLSLNGIMELMGRKIAIINNEILREGDIIHKHRIKSIGKDRVTLIYKKKKITLELKELVTMKGRGFKK